MEMSKDSAFLEKVKSGRCVRVYVASTFPDLEKERKELTRCVFPKLRLFCAKIGLILIDVDLRIGQKSEKDAEDYVLNYGLSEIGQYPSFFICLLGERYGLIPQKIPDELSKKESWLTKYPNVSVTELEIIKWSQTQTNRTQAFYFFRSPRYLSSIPESDLSNFVEEIPTGDKKSRSRDKPECSAQERAQKLIALKEKIKASNGIVRDGFNSSTELGEMVFDDVKKFLERLFPVDIQKNIPSVECSDNQEFATIRREIYVANPDYYLKLSDHAKKDDQPMIVMGDQGLGKSALLSNWTEKYSLENPQDLIVSEFPEALPNDADEADLIHRILRKIQREFSLNNVIPNNIGKMKRELIDVLNAVSTKKRIILVLDGLHLIREAEAGNLFDWLKINYSSNVRIIVSIRSEIPPFDLMLKRGWHCLKLEPLEKKLRRQIIQEYVSLHRLSLNPPNQERIISTNCSANPLFLTTIMKALTLAAKPAAVPGLMNDLLSSGGQGELFEKVIDFLEKDYDQNRPWLVRDVLTVLFGSRKGLSEPEILEFLGGGSGNPVPRYLLEPLYRALRPFIINQSGLMTFFHEAFFDAVRKKYFLSELHIPPLRMKIADYFKQIEPDFRKFEELPWQLVKSKSWDALYKVLSEPFFFSGYFSNHPRESCLVWRTLESNSAFRIIEAYSPILLEPQKFLPILDIFADFLREVGLLRKAISLQKVLSAELQKEQRSEKYFRVLEKLTDNLFLNGDFVAALPGLAELEKTFRETKRSAELSKCLFKQALVTSSLGRNEESLKLFEESQVLFRVSNDLAGLEACLGKQASLIYAQGNMSFAMTLFEEQEQLCRQLGRTVDLTNALMGKALILRAWGDLDKALVLLKESEMICRQLNFIEGLPGTLNNQASIIRTRGNLSGALFLFQEAESICSEYNDQHGLQISLGGQASVYRGRGDLTEAMRLFKEQERICQMLGNREGLQISLCGQSVIMKERGLLRDAMDKSREAEKICRDLGYKEGLQRILCNQAMILKDLGDLDGALGLMRESEKICRDLHLKSGLQRTLENLALVLKARGDLDGALALLKEQEKICRELGLLLGLQVALGNQAHILYFRGDVDSAMNLFREQEKICRDLEARDRLQTSLGGQAVIYRAWGDWKRSMELLKEQEKICLELGLKGGLQISLYNQGIILLIRGDLDGAMNLFKKQEDICREAGYKEGLQASFGSQAVIHRNRGNLDASMALFQDQEKICRESGYKEGLQVSLCGQAAILQARNELDLAMAKLKEGEKICRDLIHKEGLQRILCSESQILQIRGDLKGAMELSKEVEKICRSLDYKSGLQRALEYQAVILIKQGELGKAMKLLLEQEQICRDLGIKAGLAAALSQQAMILKFNGELDKALILLKEQEEICRELGIKAGLARSMANQAEILSQKPERSKEAFTLLNEAYRLAKTHGLNALSGQIQNILNSVQSKIKVDRVVDSPGDFQQMHFKLSSKIALMKERGDLNAAFMKLKEHERTCRELGMTDELANTLASQAQILREKRDFEGALSLLKEEGIIWRKRSNKGLLAESLTYQAWILAFDLNRPQEAIPLAEEAYGIAQHQDLPEISLEILKQLVDCIHSKVR